MFYKLYSMTRLSAEKKRMRSTCRRRTIYSSYSYIRVYTHTHLKETRGLVGGEYGNQLQVNWSKVTEDLPLWHLHLPIQIKIYCHKNWFITKWLNVKISIQPKPQLKSIIECPHLNSSMNNRKFPDQSSKG